MADDNMDKVTVESTPKVEAQHLTSFDQINKIIKRKDIAYASHYSIPSLKRTLLFNEINTSQQKRLVKSVIDSPVYNTEFICTFREILKENCQDTEVNIDDLTIIDKLIIALGLRIKSIGNNVDIEIETKDNKKVNVSLDIYKILQMALTNLQNIEPVIVEDSYYIVECSVPSIGIEYKLEKELRSKETKIEIENVSEMRQTVGDAFIGEIVKYISKVSVKATEEEVIQVDWQQFNLVNRIKVVETFKTVLLRKVIDYINTVRKEVDKVELVKFEFDGTTYERRLSIDGNFFTIS